MTLIAILVLIVAAVALFKLSVRYRTQQAESADLRGVTRLAEEDVTCLGEEVAELDLLTAGLALDESGRDDYRRALDGYDRAKTALAAVRRPEGVRAVTTALEEGRYAAACVRARAEGRLQPVRRPPCFFNPQHGPSVEDVRWTPEGGLPRTVPVCPTDAERLASGAEPDIRKVSAGRKQRRPYWDAGPAYAPYAQGYFTTYAHSGLLPAVLLSGAMVSGVGSGGVYYDHSGDLGGGGWVGDFGGGDFGGGGFGGGDFGGGGGGDFGGG